MRLLATILLLIVCGSSHAQAYRITYDSSTIPELYFETKLALEQQVGNQWMPVRERYTIRSKQPGIAMKNNTIHYDPQALTDNNGIVWLDVKLGDSSVQLPVILPRLTQIRIRPYTDSIKPILDFYVPVDGIFSTGRVFPISADQVSVTASIGSMQGLSWSAPVDKNFDHVVFHAQTRQNPTLTDEKRIYRQRAIDKRDSPDYQEDNDSAPRR